jgi:transcriptional regulator GlxA family with amidase domain
MGRVSGFYKRKVQLAVLAYAILITAALNLDSVAFATRLWTDDLVRSAAVAAAERQQQEQDPSATRLLEEVKELNLPLGWSAADPLRVPPSGLAGWLLKLLGLAVTVLALSLGAPFWFDLLSRVARLRSTGPPPPQASAPEARPQPG